MTDSTLKTPGDLVKEEDKYVILFFCLRLFSFITLFCYDY